MLCAETQQGSFPLDAAHLTTCLSSAMQSALLKKPVPDRPRKELAFVVKKTLSKRRMKAAALHTSGSGAMQKYVRAQIRSFAIKHWTSLMTSTPLMPSCLQFKGSVVLGSNSPSKPVCIVEMFCPQRRSPSWREGRWICGRHKAHRFDDAVQLFFHDGNSLF